MFPRSLSIPKNNSFFLFGARGVGKTHLIRSHFNEMDSVLFIDLLDLEALDRYSVSPQTLMKEVRAMKERPEWIILDEVQKAPDLLNVVHQLIESPEPVKFVLLGSSSRKLKQKGVNLLAGRAWLRSLFPMSFIELGESFDLASALNWGTLPKTFHYTSDADRMEYLKSYVHTYISTEVQEEQWVRKIVPFRKFLPIAAQMNGRPLNYSKIARDTGVESPTIQSYYEILEDTLLGFHLPSFHKSLRKQQREATKFYFFDTGVKKALQKILQVPLVPQTSEWGMAFEHYLITEIYRLNEYFQKDFALSYFLTKDNFEIDLIVERPGKNDLYIEIKSAEKVYEEDFRYFSEFVAETHAEGLVLSNDPIARDDLGVSFRPWQMGIKDLFQIS